jgi:hypothetical protein
MTLKVWHLFALIGFAALVIFGGIASVTLLSHHQPAGTRTIVQVLSVDGSQQDRDSAIANLRSAIPAMEAYAADHGDTYAGATLEELQRGYDETLSGFEVVSSDAVTYCVQSTVGTASAFKAGPGADIQLGVCPRA